MERYKSSQGAGSGQGAFTSQGWSGEESCRTTWNGGGGEGVDWVRAQRRSPKGSGPEEEEVEEEEEEEAGGSFSTLTAWAQPA